jgi:hypothetical protein
LTFANHKDGDRRRKPDAKDAGEAAEKSLPKKRAAVPEVGDALRSAYQRTVNEDIPPEMLDLLGKLG